MGRELARCAWSKGVTTVKTKVCPHDGGQCAVATLEDRIEALEEANEQLDIDKRLGRVQLLGERSTSKAIGEYCTELESRARLLEEENAALRGRLSKIADMLVATTHTLDQPSRPIYVFAVADPGVTLGSYIKWVRDPNPQLRGGLRAVAVNVEANEHDAVVVSLSTPDMIGFLPIMDDMRLVPR